MDNNTLNGFEVFEEFMPGSVINNNTQNTGLEDNFDGASEELTDEELEKFVRIIILIKNSLKKILRITQL